MMPRFANNKVLTKARPALGKIVAAVPRQLAKSSPKALLADVRELIVSAREQVAQVVNAGMTMVYWQIGQRIRQDILKDKRASYGDKIVVSLARQLEKEFGGSFAEKNLRRMIQFAEVFSDRKIVVSLIRQLSWTHLIALIPIGDPLGNQLRTFVVQHFAMRCWIHDGFMAMASGSPWLRLWPHNLNET